MVVYIYRMNVKDKFYIGSTKDIKYRIARHKSRCYNQNYKEYNIKVYKYIRENCNDWDEVSFQIIDVYDNISIEFKREIEQYYIDYFSNNLNMVRAKFDKQIYYIKSNKKRIEKRRIKVKCECGIISGFTNIARHRKTKIHQKLLNK